MNNLYIVSLVILDLLEIIVNELKEILNQYQVLEDETFYAIFKRLKPVEFSKNEIILREGGVCKSVYFLNEGSIKSFYTHHDAEHTNWIYYENEFFTSWYSFTSQKESIEGFKALEETKGFVLGIDSLNELKTIHPDFSLFWAEYLQMILGLYDFLSKKSMVFSAREKYEFLQSHYPILFQRASNKDIASIMGLTRETVSRIRRDLAK